MMKYCKIILAVVAVLALVSSGSAQGRAARINVKIIEGSSERTVPVDVTLADTVASVKAKIASTQRIAAYRQQYAFNGVVLEDRRSLADYGVVSGDVLRLTVRAPSV